MNKLLANIILVAIVLSTACIAITVYHAHLPNQIYTYVSDVALTGRRIIGITWATWLVGSVTAYIIGYVRSFSARQERISMAPEPVDGMYRLATQR